MDLILLPPETADSSELPWLFTGDGRLRFERMMNWLAAEGVAFDVYVFLTPATGDAREHALDLLSAARRRARNTFALVPVASVETALLSTLERRLIENVLLISGDDAPGSDCLGPDRAALRALEDHISENPNSRLQFGAWMSPESGSANFRKARLYPAAGISPAVINPPAFALPSKRNGKLPPPPAEFLEGLLGCELYSNSLTIDGQGNVLACPRDESVNPAMGSLATHPAEELIVRRGRCSPLAGCMEPCLDCSLRGRFYWANRKTWKLSELFRTGLEQKVERGNALSHLEAIPQRDLAAAPAEELERDLRAFEERLAAWGEGMEEWDAGSPGR